ncbi:MAG: hypothetical protein ACRD5M_16645 [Candidatus Acidiferrales bacterium]
MRILKFGPLLIFLLWPTTSGAQDCKLRFSVAYLDGKSLQVGLTPDQKKFWTHKGAVQYPGLCLDDLKPDHLIIWMRGTPDEEIAQSAARAFKRARDGKGSAKTQVVATQTGEPITPGVPGYYWVFDLSGDSTEIIFKGAPVIFRHGPEDQFFDEPTGNKFTPNTITVVNAVQALKLPLDRLKKIQK